MAVGALQGMPGVGKSHLADHFFAQHAASFPGGLVRLVLARDDDRSAEALFGALADKLGLRVDGGVREALTAPPPPPMYPARNCPRQVRRFLTSGRPILRKSRPDGARDEEHDDVVLALRGDASGRPSVRHRRSRFARWPPSSATAGELRTPADAANCLTAVGRLSNGLLGGSSEVKEITIVSNFPAGVTVSNIAGTVTFNDSSGASIATVGFSTTGSLPGGVGDFFEIEGDAQLDEGLGQGGEHDDHRHVGQLIAKQLSPLGPLGL